MLHIIPKHPFKEGQAIRLQIYHTLSELWEDSVKSEWKSPDLIHLAYIVDSRSIANYPIVVGCYARSCVEGRSITTAYYSV